MNIRSRALCGAALSVAALTTGAIPTLAQTYKTIQFPSSINTSANGINGSNEIVGTYSDSSGVSHGFLINKGHFQTIRFPGQPNDGLAGINDNGVIVGSYTVPTKPFGSKSIGFVDNHGTFTQVNFPGAKGTGLNGISNAGVIVGVYTDTANQTHGFELNHGRFASIDVPGATATIAFGINKSGDICGTYLDSASILASTGSCCIKAPCTPSMHPMPLTPAQSASTIMETLSESTFRISASRNLWDSCFVMAHFPP